MVTVARKRVGTRDYYYMQQTVRRGTHVEKKEVYLGPKIPKNIEEMKRKFRADVFRQQWYPLLDQIRRGFLRDARRTPATASAKEREAFAIRFTYDTQRIEGSTLTLRETADLLEKGITPRGRPISDVKEAEAHRALFEEVMRHPKDLSRQIVLYWHRKLFLATKPDIAGTVRRHQVHISGSRFVPPFPAEIEPLLRAFFRWHGKTEDSLHPVERAALVHLKFVTIHPFADGNGRISRLLMNFVLNKAGFPMLNIPYEGRASYYRALERAQTLADDLVFVRWLVKRYLREHKRFLG